MNTWTIITTLITGFFFGFFGLAGVIALFIRQEDKRIAAEQREQEALKYFREGGFTADVERVTGQTYN